MGKYKGIKIFNALNDIEAIKSEAPLITFGCSVKSFVELTYPLSFIHDFIFDKSPLQAFFACEIMLKPHLEAAL